MVADAVREVPVVSQTIVVQKTQYPDSLEVDFGGPRKGGKLYFDASNPKEAKQRLTNMVEVAVHADKELQDFKKQVGEQSASK